MLDSVLSSDELVLGSVSAMDESNHLLHISGRVVLFEYDVRGCDDWKGPIQLQGWTGTVPAAV